MIDNLVLNCSPLQPRDDNEEQATFRAARNRLWKKWSDLGMLSYKLVWSKHTDANKVSMCREAMAELGWSANLFDTCMEDHVASRRRKIKLKRQRSREADSDEDSGREVISIADSSEDSPSKTPKKRKVKREPESPPAAADEDADGDNIRHYGNRARVSLLDAEGRAMAHGVILDNEPKIPDDADGMEFDHPWTSSHEELPNCRVGSFKQVKLVAIVRSLHFLPLFGFICALDKLYSVLCRGWGPTSLDDDTVFNSEWKALKKAERTLSKLESATAENEEGYMIWHDMIVPRKGPQKQQKLATKSIRQKKKRR